MPRGNSPEVQDEFASEYGVKGNAEYLIQANRARRRKLRPVNLKRTDVASTQALDLDKVQTAADKAAKDADRGKVLVLSAAVRGGKVVAVIEDEDGRTDKLVLDDGLPTKAQVEKARERLDEARLGEDPTVKVAEIDEDDLPSAQSDETPEAQEAPKQRKASAKKKS